jgi:hypothetical protein
MYLEENFLIINIYLKVFAQVVGAIIVPITVNPWMILPLVVMGVMFYFLQSYFLSTGRELKRLDNIGEFN